MVETYIPEIHDSHEIVASIIHGADFNHLVEGITIF